jgi:hypothetical protein
MAEVCFRRLMTGTAIARVSSKVINTDQGRISEDVQTDCQYLKLLSSHCTAFQRSIMLVLTVFAPGSVAKSVLQCAVCTTTAEFMVDGH